MRGAFLETLLELASQDDRILLLTADLGFTVLEPFQQTHPARFFNVGVAEQNMVAMSTGLAEAGYIPFLYSIGTFASLRGYEMLRDGPVLHHLPARIVGVGAGYEYGSAGITHHSLEDVAVMRAQPGLRVIAPADPEQTRAALRATWDDPGPVYYRIGKNDRVSVPGLDGRFTLDAPEVIHEGEDVLLVVMGAVAAEVVGVAQALQDEGIGAAVAVVSSLHPSEALTELLARYSHIATIEDHYITGGVGSLVAEAIAEHGLHTRLRRFGARDMSGGRSGSQTFLRTQQGYAPEQLRAAIAAMLTIA